MREPLRLREGGEDLLAASLLDAARAYRRPASSRNRIMKTLGLPIAFSVGAPASVAIASSLATKVVILVSAATIAASGGAVAYQVHVRTQIREAREARASSRPRVVASVGTPPRIAATPTRSDPGLGPALEDRAVAPVDVPPAVNVPPPLSRPRLARPTPSPRAPSLSHGSSRPAPSSTPGRSLPEATTPEPLLVPDPKPIAAPVVASAPSDRRERVSMPIVSALSPAVSPPRRAPLAREIGLLDSAERAERRHDHAAALASLNQYARAFPDGALLAEAEVLRISALLGSGDETAAREHARLFFARYAPSPLAARVRSMLSGQSRQMKELP